MTDKKNNTGVDNTGNCNTGNRNTGDWNTGNWNTGDRNTGNWNTGNCNTGNRNTGNRNTGDLNTGNWNTGYWNTGYLNTIEPTEYLFLNKPCSIPRDELEFPHFFYFDLTEWIDKSDMTDQEKEQNPTYKTTGGYLKSREYKVAWREAWDKADDEDRRKCLNLPNWDNEVFKEISGIDVEAELKVKSCTPKEIIVDGKKYKLAED